MMTLLTRLGLCILVLTCAATVAASTEQSQLSTSRFSINADDENGLSITVNSIEAASEAGPSGLLRLPFDMNSDSGRPRTVVANGNLIILDGFNQSPLQLDLASIDFQAVHEFSGLASFYNQWIPFENGDYVGWKRRFDVITIYAPGAVTAIDENQLTIDLTAAANPDQTISLYLGPLSEINTTFSAFDAAELSYLHLWTWLRPLARMVETTLIWIHTVTGHWGFSILLLALLVKLVLVPLSMWSNRLQRQVTANQCELEPKLAQIKREFDGEQAHNRIMAAYKELGISPFHTMKPMAAMLVLIPVFIAVFNALGETVQLSGQGFGWIEDLALPDTVLNFGFHIPLMGSGLNLMPFVMTLLTLLSTMAYTNSAASDTELKRQKRNLNWLAVAFFVLFYPFPSAMVLYWAAVNLLHMFQQRLIRI